MTPHMQLPDKNYADFTEDDWQDVFDQHWEQCRGWLLLKPDGVVPETYVIFFERDGRKYAEVLCMHELREVMTVRGMTPPRQAETMIMAGLMQSMQAKAYIVMSETWAVEATSKVPENYRYGYFGDHPGRRECLSVLLSTSMKQTGKKAVQLIRMGTMVRRSGSTQGAQGVDDPVVEIRVYHEKPARFEGVLPNLLELDLTEEQPKS